MEKLSKEILPEEIQQDDEFDELCIQLLHIEPPKNLVDQIMRSVTGFPLDGTEGSGELRREGLIVQHNSMQPS